MFTSSHLLSCAPISSCALPPTPIHYHSLSIASDRVHEFTFALVRSYQLLCAPTTPIHYHSLSITSDRVHEFTSALVRSYQLLCAPTNSYPLSFTLNNFRPCARVHICSCALLSTLVRSHQLLSTIIHSQ